MNVLHIDEQTGWRGGEQQASWLMQGLAARGHRVLVAGRPGEPFLQSDHGGAAITRIPLPLRAEFDLYSAWRMAQTVRAQRIDLLHAHSSHAHTLALLARKLAGRGRVVVSRRVSFPPKADPLNRWKYHAPDKLIAVSENVAKVLRESGLPAERVAMVHSSVDLARLEVEPLSRSELGLPQEVPFLFNAGALVGHKDHENLLRAFALVLRAVPEARLLIAGEGDLRASIESLIAELNLAQAVRLLGHRKDVPRLVRAADCYISSSWSEGLGTSILEALACGTPVVATRAGGADEMVHPGETGYLVPCRDHEALAQAVTESLAHRSHARAMAEKGLALVKREFSTEGMIEGTLRVYESLLETPEGRTA